MKARISLIFDEGEDSGSFVIKPTSDSADNATLDGVNAGSIVVDIPAGSSIGIIASQSE